jgi:hypothetical protein
MKLLIFFLLTCVSTFAQTNSKEIKIFAMDSKEVQNTLDTLGEGMVKLKRNPKTIENVSRKDIQMLKKLAIKQNANAISVDIKRLWTNNDMSEKDDYYILYLKVK